jgi:hypothetical protein
MVGFFNSISYSQDELAQYSRLKLRYLHTKSENPIGEWGDFFTGSGDVSICVKDSRQDIQQTSGLLKSFLSKALRPVDHCMYRMTNPCKRVQSITWRL